ncbi:hypothetical protein HDU67_001565 [Dinochytrium kinnereticum]|nr:hypothetical protein HDU67_001565 [Dinochytrium kinnereticum]
MLLSLPPELLFQMTEFLDTRALLLLSATCWAARSTVLFGDAGNLCGMMIAETDPLPSSILYEFRREFTKVRVAQERKKGSLAGDEDGRMMEPVVIRDGGGGADDLGMVVDMGGQDMTSLIPPIASVSLPDGSVWIPPFPNTTTRLFHSLSSVDEETQTRITPDPSILLDFANDGVRTLDRRHLTVRFNPTPLSNFFDIALDVRKYDSIETLHGPVEDDDVEPESVIMASLLPHPNQQVQVAVEGGAVPVPWNSLAGGGNVVVGDGAPQLVEQMGGAAAPFTHDGSQAGITRRVYKGMRHYFSRSVHSRLPLHMMPVVRARRMLNLSTDHSTSPLTTLTQKATNPINISSSHHHHHHRHHQQSEILQHHPLSGYFYFEVKMHPLTASPTEDLRARVGVSQSLYSSHHLPGSLPSSIGYQSEDGFLALGHRDGETYQFAPPWTYGDVIGCGFVPQMETKGLGGETYTRGLLFFTRNGEWVGDAAHRIDRTIKDFREAWHACAGASVPVDMEFNLLGEYGGAGGDAVEMKGTPFIYAPANVMMKHRMDSLIDSSPRRRPSLAPPSTPQPPSFTPPHLRSRFWSDVVDEDPFAQITSPTTVEPLLCADLSPSVDPYLKPLQNPTRSTTYEFQDNGPMVPRILQSPTPLRRPHSTSSPSSPPLPGTYFEITLQEGGDPLTFIAIGVAIFPYSPFHHVGWDFGSIGFHSDDGRVYDGTNQGGKTIHPIDVEEFVQCHDEIMTAAASETSTRYTRGDTVGVGLTSEGSVYFTVNGKPIAGVVRRRQAGCRCEEERWFLAREEVDMFEMEDERGVGGPVVTPAAAVKCAGRGWKLHPTVSACGRWVVDINVGERPFVYRGGAGPE